MPMPPLPATALGVLLLLAAVATAPFPLEAAQSVGDEPQELVQVEVASVGVDLASAAPLALLHSDWENVLPIWIGEAEAVAIARALQGMTVPRPMTHDLLVGVMETLGGTLEEVRVTEIRDATFYGLLRIRTAGGIREVDTRPSDALALAVRTQARILVAPQLLEDVPEVEFLSAEGGNPIVRIRGVTVGASDGEAGWALADPPQGVRVLHAASDVQARGLQRGDVVTRVEGRATREPLDFLEAMRDQRGTGAVSVTRIRDGAEDTIQLPPRRGPARTGQ
jgi:uncharacterized protein